LLAEFDSENPRREPSNEYDLATQIHNSNRDATRKNIQDETRLQLVLKHRDGKSGEDEVVGDPVDVLREFDRRVYQSLMFKGEWPYLDFNRPDALELTISPSGVPRGVQLAVKSNSATAVPGSLTSMTAFVPPPCAAGARSARRPSV
jgi:hypothetical protein